MMTRLPLILLATLSLAGCKAHWDQVREELAHTGGNPPCDATDVQGLIGQRVDVAMMERLMKATRAENFRWAPPNSAMTMDYRPDRLTVAYDEQMAITRISCG
ncbi:I78 family peptidase inhibitor [Croceibacterium ferulae]|uniref:I78 family peptidase inhibitor n=1 Tax=Croceibacterium ferulae TaxID=1854641 RepID=UPI001F4E6AEB|nr:I78 family peptidase inhibitor [Croceibacterium ferulae]